MKEPERVPLSKKIRLQKQSPIKFNRAYARVYDVGYIYNPGDIVDRAGYQDLQTQIKNLINAGQSFEDLRRFQFDFPDGVVPPDAEPDITRYHDFDSTVARARLIELNKRAARARQEAQENAELERLQSQQAQSSRGTGSGDSLDPRGAGGTEENTSAPKKKDQ